MPRDLRTDAADSSDPPVPDGAGGAVGVGGTPLVDDLHLAAVRLALGRGVRRLAAAALGPGVVPEPEIGVLAGEGPGTVVVRALVVVATRRPPPLDRLATILEGAGWVARHHDGTVERVVARGGLTTRDADGPRAGTGDLPVTATVTWDPAEALMRVELSCPPMEVGRDRARALVAGPGPVRHRPAWLPDRGGRRS